MSLSKDQLSVALKRKYLDLHEKIAILEYANERKMGCRKLAEHFSVDKTAISIILKDSENLPRDYKILQKALLWRVSCN